MPRGGARSVVLVAFVLVLGRPVQVSAHTGPSPLDVAHDSASCAGCGRSYYVTSASANPHKFYCCDNVNAVGNNENIKCVHLEVVVRPPTDIPSLCRSLIYFC